MVTPRSSQFHLDASVVDTAGVSAESHASRTRHRLARGDVEASIVLGTFDLGAVDETVRKQGAAVRAHCVDGKESIIGGTHDRDRRFFDGDADDVFACNVIGRTDDVPARLRHGNTRVKTTD